MARCSNAALLAKIGLKAIDANQEIDFSVRRDLPECRRINAKNYRNTNGVTSYNRYHKPKNRFECGADGCSTTGTLTVSGTMSETTPIPAVDYYAQFDATEFSSGVIAFYVEGENFPKTIAVQISDSAENYLNSDVYQIELTENMKTDDGFIPVIVDLSQTPTSVEGNGWEASQNGAYINFYEVAESGDVEFGISSISILDSVYDFETMATVKMSCISSAGGSYDLSLIEQTCRKAELDTTISSLSFPISARLITPNHYLLSPMYQKGTETEGFELVTVSRIVEQYTNGSQRFGRVHLTDAHPEECRFYGVQIEDTCSPFEGMLSELTLPVVTAVDAGHFQILRNQDGVDILFNETLIGLNVLVEYPKIAEIEEIIMGTDDLNGVHTSMTVPYVYDGGVKELHVYDDVLVTGFPFGLSNSDTDVSFTITVTKKNNRFFRIQRYV